MSFRDYIGITGVLVILAGGMLPMLRVPIVGNWNYWDIDLVLATIFYSLAGLTLLAILTGKYGLRKFCTWAMVFMLAFTLAAVYFEVSNYFNFIPIKKLASAASGLIKFKWLGWGVIAAGIILTFFSRQASGSAAIKN